MRENATKQVHWNLNDLHTFLRVAELGSFAGAAVSLGLPRSTVSRRVARLEDALGVALMVRAPRSARLTDQGALLSRRCAPAIRDLADVERMLSDAAEQATGTLRLTAPSTESHAPAFARLLVRYRQACPDVSLEVVNTGRNVDLIEEGFDVALRPGGPSGVGGAGLMRRTVGTTAMRLFTSPSVVAEGSVPEHFRDLAQATVVGHRVIFQSGAHQVAEWKPDWRVLADLDAAVLIDDFTIIAEVVAGGCGIGVLPTMFSDRYVADGRLVEVYPEVDLGRSSLYLLWPESRHLSLRVRRFIDLAVEELARDGELVWD